MAINEKRYFLKNANLLEEINNSKITYCCYTNKEYTTYDIICDGYSLVTPNVIDTFFNKNKSKTKEAMLAKVTIITMLLFAINTVVLNII